MKRALAILSVVLVGAGWLAYWGLGHMVARRVAERWGARMVQAGDGKFSDAALFLQNRFFEGAWLLTLTVVVLALVALAGAWFARRLPALWKWISYAAAGFVGLNVWLKFAMATCLFWCVFWNGKGTTDNLTQFNLKRILMKENRAPVKVVLAGSSQVRAEIDPRLLNRQLGSNIFSTELHFPGNHGYDFLFLSDELKGQQADIFVCYLSELNFYSQGLSAGFSLFFDFSELPDFLRLGGKPGWGPRSLGYGLVGNVLPAFRMRGPVAQRLLGNGVTELEQNEQLASRADDLEMRGVDAARGYRAGAQSTFEMVSLERFVGVCQARHQTVVLCCGQLNPLLAAHLDPALRPQMLEFLRQLGARHPNVVVLGEDELPKQTAADYEDLTHVNREAQVVFSKAIGEVLKKLAAR